MKQQIVQNARKPAIRKTRSVGLRQISGHRSGVLRQHDLGSNHVILSSRELPVSRPEDTCEREADHLAQRVVQPITQGLQHRNALNNQKPTGKNKRTRRQRLPNQAHPGIEADTVPPISYQPLQGSGYSLDRSTQGFMESRFGQSFDKVRIHTGRQAARMAQSMNARALTIGHDIVFAHGEYRPGTVTGKRLLAHELTHVIQQTGDNETNGTTPENPMIQRQFLPPQPPEMEQPSQNQSLEIVQPTANSQFQIDDTPTMPTINCQARINGADPDPTPNTDFNWSIEVTETVTPDNCASSRIGNCTMSVSDNGVRGGRWAPGFSATQGGDATIRVEALAGGPQVASVNVNIRGVNPATGDIRNRLGGAGTDADHIACRESRWRQINATGDHPLLGPGGDVGVMQLCNPAANCTQRWDWTENVDRGLDLLNDKEHAARRHLNTHRADGNYPNNQGLDNAGVLRREKIQRYNGGSYWSWNSENNQWQPDPPNNYVNHVINCS